MGFSLESVKPNKEYIDPTKSKLLPLPEKGQLFLEGKRTQPKATKVAKQTTNNGSRDRSADQGELAQVTWSVSRGSDDSKLNLVFPQN